MAVDTFVIQVSAFAATRPRDLCNGSQLRCAPRLSICPMSARYYTHFVTNAEAVPSSEWSGVIELTRPLAERKDSKELRSLLAANFEVAAEDIKILQVSRLH
jgi:hypothetical protein